MCSDTGLDRTLIGRRIERRELQGEPAFCGFTERDRGAASLQLRLPANRPGGSFPLGAERLRLPHPLDVQMSAPALPMRDDARHVRNPHFSCAYSFYARLREVAQGTRSWKQHHSGKRVFCARMRVGSAASFNYWRRGWQPHMSNLPQSSGSRAQRGYALSATRSNCSRRARPCRSEDSTGGTP